MREIKFRAWDGRQMVHSGDYWSGENQQLGNSSICYPVSVLHYGILWCKKYPRPMPDDAIELDRVDRDGIEFMQYTGLRDRNGVEIYEGDIVKAADGTHKVEYDDPLELHPFQLWVAPDGETWMDRYGHSFEVIGNVYKNPELLGGDRG